MGINAEMNVALRPIEPDDEELLYRVYASMREELAQTGYDDAREEDLLQFDAFLSRAIYYGWRVVA